MISRSKMLEWSRTRLCIYKTYSWLIS